MIPYCQSQQAEESFEGLAYAVAAVATAAAAAATLGPGLYDPSGDTGGLHLIYCGWYTLFV